jgi:polysaccharide biosynthesis protein PslH
MRLLLILPFFPYPPNDGGRIGFFNPIKYLSRSHELFVACVAEPEAGIDLAGLKQHCADVRVFRRPAFGRFYGLFKGTFSEPPGTAATYWYPAAGEMIREMICAYKPEVVEFHHLHTAVYRRYAGTLPAILREHNVEYKVWERYAEHATGWAEKCYARWTAPRIMRYESEVAQRFDRCVVVSHADAEHLRSVSPSARIEVIPSGVDTEYFFPLPDIAEDPLLITLTGSFEWRPKQQSLFKLLKDVFPLVKKRIPGVKLQVVGKGMPEDLKLMAEGISGVKITGAVPDVRPYIAQSSLLINYLESGGGIALKVLEAMAMRKAVLCNALGCEGIPVTPGRDVLVADGPEDFAEAAAQLIKNESARRAVAYNGYRRVQEEYSWRVLAGAFERCYRDVIWNHKQRLAPGESEDHAYSLFTGD